MTGGQTGLRLVAGVLALVGCAAVRGQTAAAPLPNAPQAQGTAVLRGTITDTDSAAIPNAKIVLEDPATKRPLETRMTDAEGAFSFPRLLPGRYMIRITAQGFSPWKVEDIDLQAEEDKTLTTVELGVEALNATVNAITVEDLAEQQITAEEHQRILGMLPNFYVSYLGAGKSQPLTRRQKFKLAAIISTDPLTLLTTGITAGLEQAQNDFSGYGPGIGGYGQRYAATYGDRLSATFIGSAALPSLLRQDPRYFYNGHGSVLHRALYAVSTVVMCKGDNGKWQPNYSNVGGNLSSGFISGLYYPRSDRHTAQVTLDNALLGLAEGSIGTLVQEFLLRHLTKGVPEKTP